MPVFGTFSDGAMFKPYQMQGQTTCPFVGNTGPQRCALVQWNFAHSAYNQQKGNIPKLS